MDDLDFVKKLESNEELFNREYDKLGEFYNVRRYEKIHDYFVKHKGLIVLLNKLKSRLSEDFPTGKFDLVHYTDYEYSDWSYILLYIKVDDYTFNNGVMEDIKKITFDFIPLRRKLGVMSDLSLRPALYDC